VCPPPRSGSPEHQDDRQADPPAPQLLPDRHGLSAGNDAVNGDPTPIGTLHPLAIRESGTGGYGLGLAMSKRIMEAHGGSITAANNPDRGAF
jgi:hypothetical protein